MPDDTKQLIPRPVPSTLEPLPVIGIGTWQAFDVGAGAAERAPLREVLKAFAAGGGRVVDSSPMYGAAESVAGDLIAELACARGSSSPPRSGPAAATPACG